MTPRRARASAPPGSPIPASGAYFEVAISEADAFRTGEATTVQVRCFTSHSSRLFDVVKVQRFDPDYGMQPTGALMIQRKCPACKLINSGLVTAAPGFPWTDGPVLDGPWVCTCTKSLGYVDSIRGRIKTSCRCGTVVRVVAATAIAVASVPTRPVPEVGDAAGDGFGSFADASF